MNSELSKEIGNRINSLLAIQDKKQKDLASYLGVQDNTISYFISGKRMPNTEQIIKIANFFNTTSDYILGLTKVKTTDKDLKFVCDYIGLDENTVNKFIEFKNMLFLPRSIEYINIIPTFLTYTKHKYFEMFNNFLNIFLQSDSLLEIMTVCCVEEILEYSLKELSEFKNVDINGLSEYKQERIKQFYSIAKNYSKQHKLNLFNAQNSVIDFIKSATKLENIDREEIENTIEEIGLEIFKDDENILNDENTDIEPSIFGYSLNDLESVADIIIDNNYNLSSVLKDIKQRHLFKTDEEIQTYIIALKRLVNNKKDGAENGNDN